MRKLTCKEVDAGPNNIINKNFLKKKRKKKRNKMKILQQINYFEKMNVNKLIRKY